MLLFEPQHLPRLPITKRALILAQLSCNGRVGLGLFQILHGRHLQRRRRVGSIKNLKTQSTLLYA